MLNKVDCYFIRKTFELANKGEGTVSPNPLVGVVIVKDGRTLGIGYHKGKGKPHAEVCAIEDAGKGIEGATLYVSLEPCCHYGDTPPCTDLIVRSGIKRVVAPIKDPNSLINGKGFEILRNNGIEITTGILKEEALELNQFYLKYIRTKIPYVILKAALTLDGRISAPERNIFKITSKESLIEVHRLRKKVDAILVGVGTVISDDPGLDVRLVKSNHEPYKIVIDPHLRTPKDARIFTGSRRVIMATLLKKSEEKYPASTIWTFKEKDGSIPVKDILKKAGEFGITSILVEGGSKTFANFITSGEVDKYLLFYSPSFLGDGIPFLAHSVKREFLETRIRKIGNDLLVEAECSRE